MYLAAVKEGEEVGRGEIPGALPISARWSDVPFSCLSHHGEACCDAARDWLLATDWAQLNGGALAAGPRWLGHRYKWGPSSWPMHWCEAMGRKVVDCGVHAAFAHETFAARGLQAFRAQYVQLYNPDAIEQWRRKWKDDGVSDHWVSESAIYHEGNAVLIGADEVKLWDPSAGWWINPRSCSGYGSLAAVRIFVEGRFDGEALRWGAHRINPDVWQEL